MKLPTHVAIARLISDLTGRPSTVKPVTAPRPTKDGIVTALIDDEGQLCAGVFADRAFAAFAGAALAMIPSGAASDAIRKGTVPPELFDNFREVLNVASALFNEVNTTHVRLQSSFEKDVPAPLATMLAKPKAKLDLDVTIQGYGTGRLYLAA